MRTPLSLVLMTTLVLAGCGDDGEQEPTGGAGAGQAAGEGGEGGTDSSGGAPGAAGSGEEPAGTGGTEEPGSAGAGGTEEPGSAGAGGSDAPSAGSGGSPGTGGTMATAGTSSGGTPSSGDAGAGGSGDEEPVDPGPRWHECQGSDRQFVRRAILGVLGRHPVSQAEVSLYTDLIEQIDELDGYDASAPPAPGSILRNSRRVVLRALFEQPEYKTHWGDLYRDFLRVQRIDEQQNAACYGLRARPEDAADVADWVRGTPPTVGVNNGAPFTMADVIAGAIEIDDVTPIYTTNLFAMLTKTYAGANAEKVALELSRRRDFGAWFDAVYLNRDTVCLTCHNSEFSVTQTSNPETNRHYPLPGHLEKALFGSSMGPETYGGYEAGDRLHAALRFTQLVNDCRQLSTSQASQVVDPPACPPGDRLWRCVSDDLVVCSSDPRIRDRNFLPWGWSSDCGQFMAPHTVPVDMAFVEARFGNVNGLRATVWDVWTALRSGFDKLRDEGLGVQPDGTVPDPDKAFAYLTAMNVAEKVWREVVGTPLTIPTYFPRNAAARDQLQLLTEAFISSNYSNKALLEEIFSSPYVNLAPPEVGCGDEYGLPRIFDPWVTAEEDPVRRGNSPADGAVSLSSRTAARAAYAALGWPLAPYGSLFPGVRGYGEDPIPIAGSVTSGTIERQFQGEVGFFLKNSEPGFRGFDFQARLGWEDRFARCAKLPTNTEPDVIDQLVERTRVAGVGTVRDVVKVLKDRTVGNAVVTEEEQPLLEAILGASLDADASTLPEPDTSLRRVCGALVSSPQFLMIGVPPVDSLEVPSLTPADAAYGSLCEKLRSIELPGYIVTCAGNDHPLLVSPSL